MSDACADTAVLARRSCPDLKSDQAEVLEVGEVVVSRSHLKWHLPEVLDGCDFKSNPSSVLGDVVVVISRLKRDLPEVSMSEWSHGEVRWAYPIGWQGRPHYGHPLRTSEFRNLL